MSDDLCTESIEITGLSSEGEGVGRLEDGRVAFVDGGVPGDRVELRDIEARKKFVRARVAKILSPSPDRIPAPCPHFEACGGCRWQNIRYEAQLSAKRSIVTNALERIGGLEAYDEEGVDIVASPEPYGYRARARWVEAPEGLGYRERGSREIHAVDSCPVLLPTAEAALASRTAMIVAGTVVPSAQGAAIVEKVEKAGASKAAAGRAKKSKEKQGRRKRPNEWVVTVGSNGEAVVVRASATGGRGGERPDSETVTLEVLGESLRISGDSFVQGNALLWEPLAEAVRDLCVAPLIAGKPTRLVELYCGAGFFTIPIARAGLTIAAFESDRAALADLGCNLRRARLDRGVNVVPGRVETRRDLDRRLKEGDVVLVDPPRTGLEDAVCEAIAAAAPERVVYLSCNPATLARDLKKLVSAGYKVGKPKIFDLFPQTPHVETLVEITLA